MYIYIYTQGIINQIRKFLNGNFSKSDASSLYSRLKSHDVKIFTFQILEILENEGLNILRTFDN